MMNKIQYIKDYQPSLWQIPSAKLDFLIKTKNIVVTSKLEIRKEDKNITQIMETSKLKTIDTEVLVALKKEEQRQLDNLELIASENIVSPRIKEVTASVMTNKYAEGYPNKRYYEGCQNVDITEQLAIDRAKELFQAEHVNVQPHSGSQANMGVYFSILKAGDTILEWIYLMEGI